MIEKQIESKISIETNDIKQMVNLFGEHDKNMILIEKELNVEIVVRDNNIIIFGEKDKVLTAEGLIKNLINIWKTGHILTSHDIRYAITLAKGGNSKYMIELVDDIVCVTARGKNVRPKTLGQKVYAEAIRNNDIVFGIGPAGTGKTYLAMAMAVSAFKNREVNRIILTRPAVEAGEKLGFLPGDLQEKVDPYLRPLYDALYDIIGGDAYQKYIEKGMIEVAPLAYMRGRTLDDSFIILDEAQNTTTEQMKMFLTRMGFSSKAVITGDITQIDLPKGKSSGLEEARVILKNISGIEFVYLTDKDVVRHPLVQKIVKAYEEHTIKIE